MKAAEPRKKIKGAIVGTLFGEIWKQLFDHLGRGLLTKADG